MIIIELKHKVPKINQNKVMTLFFIMIDLYLLALFINYGKSTDSTEISIKHLIKTVGVFPCK